MLDLNVIKQGSERHDCLTDDLMVEVIR